MPIFRSKYPTEQTDPPNSPKETLPTMYELPSEDPEEPGLPDEFHTLQPQILSFTFRPANYPPERLFSGSDMNLYYDVHHQKWYKRPDWFGVVGVPRLYEQKDLRLSYVIWQEGVSPSVVVELLSPGTEKEDLGKSEREANQPPTKWEVYEQILRVPYYIVFNRYNNQLRAFTLTSSRYQELNLNEPRVWMPLLELGLGLWQGQYRGINRLWLRWYDAQGHWIPTETEQERREKELAQQQAQREQQRAEEAEKRAEYLAQRLRNLGIEP
ncbi:MAG: Uma2 family endonuclease [Xenococcaceae cyanobacterium]